MWIFSRNGFVGLVQHPQQADKLVLQTQTREEMDSLVPLLDEVGGSKQVVEQATDGFARFATVVMKDVAVADRRSLRCRDRLRTLHAGRFV